MAEKNDKSPVFTPPAFLSPGRANFIFGCLVTAYFFSFFFRVSASVVVPQQAANLGMSAAMAGFISSLYFYTYSVMQAVSGALHDRFGPMRVMAVGMVLSALGTVLLVFEPSSLSLGAWRFLSGIGLAPMFSGALVYQAGAFSPDRYVFYSSLTLAVGALGAVVSVAPLGWSLDSLGLSKTFAGLTGASLIIAAFIWMQRRRDPVPALALGTKAPDRSVLSRLKDASKTIFRSPYLRNILVLWAVTTAAFLALQGLWAVSWYQTAYTVSLGEARNWASLISLGMFLGTMLLGKYWGGAEHRFRAMAFWSFFNAFSWVALVLSVALKAPLPVAGFWGFCVGAANGLTAVHFVSAVKEFAAGIDTGAILGTMNTVITFTVVISQWGTGVIIGLFPGHTAGEFTATGFLACFSVVALGTLGCLFSLKALRKAR